MKTEKFIKDEKTGHIDWVVKIPNDSLNVLYKLLCGKIRFDLLVKNVQEILNKRVGNDVGSVGLLLPCEEHFSKDVYVVQFSVITEEMLPYLKIKEIDKDYVIGNSICFWMGALLNNQESSDYVHTVTYDMVKDLILFNTPAIFDFKEANVTITLVRG